MSDQCPAELDSRLILVHHILIIFSFELAITFLSATSAQLIKTQEKKYTPTNENESLRFVESLRDKQGGEKYVPKM